MKKVVLILFVLFIIIVSTACSNEEIINTDSENLTIGENAFEWGINLKYSSADKVEFYIEPVRDDIRETIKESWENSESYKGTFGTVAIVGGKKKGEKAELNGVIEVYVNDVKEPAISINVTGTYQIDDLPSYDNSSFFIYKEGVLKEVQKDEWTSFNP
jgi:hypothetical protein